MYNSILANECGEDGAYFPRYCCRIGAARAPDSNSEAASARSDAGDAGDLETAYEWWSTGILIHKCAVLTVAHGPRSELVMGDRVFLPGLKDGGHTERILRVRRIIDHPKAGREQGFDVRLLMLQLDNRGGESQMSPVQGQLAGRAFDLRNCATLEAHDECRDLRIAGFGDSPDESQGRNGHRRKWRQVTYASKDQEPAVHGHQAEREYVFKACECAVGAPGRCIAYGDSGAPVFMGRAEENKLVAMYVRRSINEPVSANPHLVAIRLNKGLIDWLDAIRRRYAP